MDKSVRKIFISLVEFLGNTLGPNYEIVLQEINEEDSGIIAIANSNISGRKIGHGLTGIALQFLTEKKYLETDAVLNYVGVLENGKIVRSSTFFIKEGNKLTGMLCVNCDGSSILEFSDMLLRRFHPDSFLEKNNLFSNKGLVTPELYTNTVDPIEYFQKDSKPLMQEIMNRVLDEFGKDGRVLSPNDRQELVNMLYRYGMFQLKDAINFVAEYLDCSTVSIYRYLKKSKEE